MERTRDRNIIYQFENIIKSADSTVVIKEPKTKESVRHIYIPTSVANMLVEYKAIQEQQIEELGDIYQNYEWRFVFSQPSGRPYETDDLSKRFKQLVAENELTEVDFCSLRHSGSTSKLRASGNIKSVQGDMGHASAQMLTKVYAAIVDEDRVNNARLMEERLFSKIGKDNESR